MKILAVDTTSYGCSVAVLEGEVTLAERQLQKRETHSKHLMKLIDDCLGQATFNIDGIDGFAVAVGPGSFTGLRIGISTMKGLAYAMDKPLVGVSSLEALAYGVPACSNMICSVIDARKNEIYASFFYYKNNLVTRLSNDFVITPDKLVSKVDRNTVFVGSGVDEYKKLFVETMDEKAVFLEDSYNYINAVNIGKLATPELMNNKKDHLLTLVPNYIRKSDAEINLKKNSRE